MQKLLIFRVANFIMKCLRLCTFSYFRSASVRVMGTVREPETERATLAFRLVIYKVLLFRVVCRYQRIILRLSLVFKSN